MQHGIDGSVPMQEVQTVELHDSPVNIKVDPVVELAIVAAWVGIDGDSNGGNRGGAVPQPQVFHIVLLNQDGIIHEHMISDSSACANRPKTSQICCNRLQGCVVLPDEQPCKCR